jgi:hypothetical protein
MVYSRGAYATFDACADCDTRAWGINNRGEVSGTLWGGGGGGRAFIYRDGTTQEFRVDGAESTAGRGINDRGQLVGFYREPGGPQRGFIRR